MMSIFSAVLIVVAVNFQAVQCFSPGGSVYTRWGRKNCPRTATMIYSGYVGGSHYLHHGGAVERLCLPRNPQWGRHNRRMEASRGYIYGAEYEVRNSEVYNQDVPCAVCKTHSEKSVIVIPARKYCPYDWIREYQGYLMTGLHSHPSASTYTCMDAHPDALHGGNRNENGYLFYLVEARCGSLKCPPYKNGWELTCVVCSKI